MEIKELLPEVQENISLAQHTTFKIGGNAKYFFVAQTKDNILKAVKAAQKCGLPFFILGGGSNILFSDNGFDGLIVKIQNPPARIATPAHSRYSVSGGQSVAGGKSKIQNNIIYAEAGVMLSYLVRLTEEAGLSGLEWAAGIYGTVGGAVRGNAGAFGGQILDVLKGVEYFDVVKDEIRQCNNRECHFDYRSSIFKENKNLIILSCEFELQKGDKENIKEKIDKYENYRLERHPLNYPSAGSIFKNPKLREDIIKNYPKIAKNGFVPAGFLIEQAGLKGKIIGKAQISEKHCNFIINLGGATAKNVLKLIGLVKKEIKNKFQIDLEEEISVI
ncbi:UDP-N-acetylmuramate dehydrogenase [Patescibacteria group bacterium]|nr:UDP-N-acetylmuramate dehydrogenase [Patescibacteria group bacterium]MBU4078163.1 UDP-N-acetylmuramate dehydrogenase [Patescibacteria group bacterium]MBU4162000.1 UDP-N-acetylmuramate dehydrogenase [Patescibacteria group bacterium]